MVMIDCKYTTVSCTGLTVGAVSLETPLSTAHAPEGSSNALSPPHISIIQVSSLFP